MICFAYLKRYVLFFFTRHLHCPKFSIRQTAKTFFFWLGWCIFVTAQYSWGARGGHSLGNDCRRVEQRYTAERRYWPLRFQINACLISFPLPFSVFSTHSSCRMPFSPQASGHGNRSCEPSFIPHDNFARGDDEA